MSDEATLPPLPNRRDSDRRIDTLERNLAENTTLTLQHGKDLAALREQVVSVKDDTGALLQMKQAFDNHLKVLCTWARWAKRILFFAVTIVLPGVVAARQMGWL